MLIRLPSGRWTVINLGEAVLSLVLLGCVIGLAYLWIAYSRTPTTCDLYQVTYNPSTHNWYCPNGAIYHARFRPIQ